MAKPLGSPSRVGAASLPCDWETPRRAVHSRSDGICSPPHRSIQLPDGPQLPARACAGAWAVSRRR